MRALIVAMAFALAAPAALAQEAGTRVTAEQNGQTVEIAQGGALVVELQVNSSTGAHWAVAEKPDFLSDPTTTIVSPPLAPGQRPLLGAPKTAQIEFNAPAAGTGDLVLEKRGPGAAGAVQDTFRITVTAQ